MENMYQTKDGYECKDHSTFFKPPLFKGGTISFSLK